MPPMNSASSMAFFTRSMGSVTVAMSWATFLLTTLFNVMVLGLSAASADAAWVPVVPAAPAAAAA